MLKILIPECGETVYRVAANAFADMCQNITGIRPEIIDRFETGSDLAVIGSDAVNDFTARAFAADWIDSFSIRYGTDDYAIRSVTRDGNHYLFLAGGRGRSTLYAVYDFFERRCGCHYFWDGDVIPKAESIDLCDLCVSESPRFDYRGLRYFAHRGLHRFQAEHWSLDDWKREIDWMVKRRMNYFMLRIGIDDIYQRAFPEATAYPSASEALPIPTDSGYDDRTLFWPLEYRGILRRDLLRYAFERDLMHSEDCGTMTHWYSRTPLDYLKEVQPQLLAQDCDNYNQKTALVWDPRIRQNMDNYMKLTDTYVRDFGKPELFHTIGLAERMIFSDRAENMKLKLFTYRRILERIRQKYPQSKMLIASWDFIGWWHPDEVQTLMREFDPERTIILDYTSEHADPEESFLNWGVVGRFPWIFGLFHAFENQSSIRGNYDRSAERLTAAANDPFCKGMIFWPELSHSDTLVLEYLARNSWQPSQTAIEPLAASFSADRYGVYAALMNSVWQSYLPLVKLIEWGCFSRREPSDPEYGLYARNSAEGSCFPMDMARFIHCCRPDKMHAPHWSYLLDRVNALKEHIPFVLDTLASLPEEALKDPFIRRDVVDIARSITEQTAHYGLMKFALMLTDRKNGANNAEALRAQLQAVESLMSVHVQIIGCHEDYSQYETLEGLRAVCPVNPAFEATLKRNLVNGYCRQAAYEAEKYLYHDEYRAYCARIENMLRSGALECDFTGFREEIAPLFDRFMERPLAEMRPRCDQNPLELLPGAARLCRQIEL